MEPVPETERMEEFRNDLPFVPIHRASHSMFPFKPSEGTRKPPTLRRSTDPSPTSPTTSPWNTMPTLTYRPRTASPLSGSHTRSRSTNMQAPPMARTRSLPTVGTPSRLVIPRPDSPSGSPSRQRSMRKPADEGFPVTTPTRSSVLDPERRSFERSSSPVTSLSGAAARIRRPSSPLRPRPSASSSSLASSASMSSSISLTPSWASSPLARPYDNIPEAHVLMTSITSSSVSSTPMSLRSRSPSISSLETIPDSPDAEEAALEAERQARAKAQAEADHTEGGDVTGKELSDPPVRGRTLGLAPRDKRKRWSVCGAERRADLDLETIWED